MSRRKPRSLTPQERDLWEKVADTTKARRPESAKSLTPQDLFQPKAPSVEPARLQPFKIGSKSRDPGARSVLTPSISEALGRAPVQMDAKAFRKMKQGKLTPEARIDLHGMTLDRAHPALINFILGAQAQGKRLVLVITGKGKVKDQNGPIPMPVGVLRHQVPQWLSQPPLRGVVMQVSQASATHGGGGAYYVYIRRVR